MDKKWSIMDKKDVSDKCCQMENAIWNIFQSPSSWINGMNGFIRLVSMDGTWYHHRATDVFIPMAQNYINRFYRLDTRPERGAIRVRSGTVYWDYLNQEEALQILPNLPTSNLPNAQEAAGLGERCRNKKIFLKDGTVYDMDKKIIRPLQWNEEGSILQICHFEDKHKRNNAVLWHYDIYLWAKAGVIPSVLYASRECWNTMQFLVDNFNKIDFDDFLSLSGMDESAVAEPEKELQEEKAESKNEQAAEPVQPAPMKTVEESKHEQAAEPVQPTPMKTVEESENEQSAEPIQSASINTVEESIKSDAAQIQERAIQNAADLQKAIREFENEPTPEMPTEENVAKLQEEAANMEYAQAIEREKEAATPENEQAAEDIVEEKTVEVQEEAANVKQAKEPEMIIEEKTVESAVLQQSQTTELMAEIKESIASAVAESQPIERTKPQPISAATQNITVTQKASVIPDFPAKLKQTTNQLEKTENMDMMQREEVTVTTDKIQELLDCDKNRCRLEPYDKDILYDIIRGHWELYDSGATEEARKNIKSESEEGAKEFIARNPKLDVKQGVVGIDFGTKSTVVVRQDATNRIVPIRIGTGNLSSEVKEEDFENPSIIEFTNVKKFLEDYQQEVGRPHTSCNDIFVSYDAYEDFRNCKPDDFYAYFNELKQWANHEKGNVIIKDKQKKEYYLGENMGETDDIVNPVELYAYYIGLHINNMRNGIYLKYLMTFPVGYAKEVRDFIAESFYKGIKKSLPTSIINDEECMAQFKVELGISEPAAYAVTALEQNHLEPKDETEQLMYGIFDFGGGTTDFDFGICRGATDEEYDKDAYDYVLECFGADSDVTLGGENILELMAYQVYQKNIDVFREKKITFTLPLGESSFAGSETLLIDSQIAKRNMAILKEELRPLWHQEQGWRKKYELENEVPNEADKEGVVVSLYNMDGEPVPQCMLEFSTQEMVEMIKNRIQKGIDSFFQCLIKIFLYKREDTVEEEPTIYIFLSGNSSKSIFVKELFKKKIEEYYSKARKAGDEMGNAHFELYEPLVGTQDGSGYYVPNAKTGVAYGLLKSREGSSIKIVKNYETDAQQQSRFRYYLGRDRRHYFDCKFSPAEISYKKWVSFQGASREVVRIYYTDNPVADSKLEQLSIENVPYKEITINPMENAYLFIRTVEPNLIEYAVAKEEDDITDSEIKNCYFI